MISDIYQVVAEVIRSASRHKPADSALREVLKRKRDLPPFDAAEVSKAVFTYYRWHGWTLDERNVEARMRLVAIATCARHIIGSCASTRPFGRSMNT